MSTTGAHGALAEVAVPTTVLHSAADLTDILTGFLTDADPATTAATIMLAQLGETAELLHALADTDR